MSFPQLRSGTRNPLATGPAQQSHSLLAENGVFAVTGPTAALVAALVLVAGSGSVAWTGTAAELEKGVTFSAESGSYSVTGTAATLTSGRVLVAGVGGYSLNGVAADLQFGAPTARMSVLPKPAWRGNYPRAFHPSLRKPIRQSGPASIVLTAASGSYEITGSEADLRAIDLTFTFNKPQAWPRPFAPGPWGHRTTQRSLNRIGGSATAFFAIDSAPGTYTWSGTAAALSKHYVFVAEPGVYAVAGATATFRFGMPADAGAYLLTGTAATLRSDRILGATLGAYTVSGTDAGLLVTVPGAEADGPHAMTGLSGLSGGIWASLRGGWAERGWKW